MKAVKAKKVMEREEYSLEEEKEYQKFLAEIDKMFEEGERDSRQGKGVPFETVVAGTRARLRKAMEEEIIRKNNLAGAAEVQAELDRMFGEVWPEPLDNGVPLVMRTEEKRARLRE